MDKGRDMKKYILVLFFVVTGVVTSMLCACNDAPAGSIQSKTAEETQSREYAQTITDSEGGSTSSLYSEPYEYPVRPGMDEWKKYGTLQQMIDASQVPEDIVDNMSTYALAKTVIEYPLVVNTLSYETPKEGIEEVSKYFYGLKAFLQREDAKESLLRIQDEGTYDGKDDLSVVRNRFLKNLITCLN